VKLQKKKQWWVQQNTNKKVWKKRAFEHCIVIFHCQL